MHVNNVEGPRQEKKGIKISPLDYNRHGNAATYRPGYEPKKRGPKTRK